MKLIIVILTIISVGVFCKSFKDVQNEVGKEYLNYLKSTVMKWYENTRMAMWLRNKRNGVTVLSENKYQRMVRNGMIKEVIVIEEETFK